MFFDGVSIFNFCRSLIVGFGLMFLIILATHFNLSMRSSLSRSEAYSKFVTGRLSHITFMVFISTVFLSAMIEVYSLLVSTIESPSQLQWVMIIELCVVAVVSAILLDHGWVYWSNLTVIREGGKQWKKGVFANMPEQTTQEG